MKKNYYFVSGPLFRQFQGQTNLIFHHCSFNFGFRRPPLITFLVCSYQSHLLVYQPRRFGIFATKPNLPPPPRTSVSLLANSNFKMKSNFLWVKIIDETKTRMIIRFFYPELKPKNFQFVVILRKKSNKEQISLKFTKLAVVHIMEN